MLADYDEAIRHDSHLLIAYLTGPGRSRETALRPCPGRLLQGDPRRARQCGCPRPPRLDPAPTSAEPKFPRRATSWRRPPLANSLSHWENPYHLTILAAAHAESGQWEKAVERQSTSIARLQGDDPDRKRFEERLEQFGQHKPVRE